MCNLPAARVNSGFTKPSASSTMCSTTSWIPFGTTEAAAAAAWWTWRPTTAILRATSGGGAGAGRGTGGGAGRGTGGAGAGRGTGAAGAGRDMKGIRKCSRQLIAGVLYRRLPTFWPHNDARYIIYDALWRTVRLWSFGRFLQIKNLGLENFYFTS